MTDQSAIHRQMQQHYERVWQGGDAWSFEKSAFEQSRFDFQLDVVGDRRYPSTLELGCGSGCFTRRLSGVSDRLLALDIAPAAIERARTAVVEADGGCSIDLRVANVMEYD